MQYHVPSGFIRPSPAVAPAANSSGVSSGTPASISASAQSNSVSSSAAVAAPCCSNGSTEVAVGQGLLSGRRLTVRVAPPSISASSSSFRATTQTGSPPPLSLALHCTGAVRSQPDSNFTESTGWPSASSPSPPPSSSLSSPAYGGGIVRISDLRRQGLQSVESGLRLNTLQGGRPAPSLVTSSNAVDRRRTDVADDANTPLADVFASTVAPARRTRRSASSATSGPGSRHRGARGSTGGRRRSRGSVEVPLTATGELCDYRWYTAGGRRCFIYDGCTYKGTTAHRMWTKVKEIASRRERVGRHSVSVNASGAATAAAAGRRTSRSAAGATRNISPRVSAAAARTRPHRMSARALAAAGRSLGLEDSSCVGARSVEAAPSTFLAPLRDEWKELMRELSVEPESDFIRPASLILPTADVDVSRLREPTHAHRTLQQSALAPANAAREVVEISDSGDSSTSDTDTHSSSPDTTAGVSTAPSHAPQVPAPLNWPRSSYFSDESSGWSSSSSPVAPRSPVHHNGPPTRKKAKTELPQQQSCSLPSAPVTSAARVRMYNGVRVVEEDGWVYPVEIYALSQQQQRRASQGANSEETTGFPTALGAASNRRVAGFASDVLQNVDDVPFADLFNQAAPSSVTAPSAAVKDRGASLLCCTFPPPPSHNSAGIAVIVSGQERAVPLRPASVLSADAGTRVAMTAAGAQSSAAILRNVNDADELDGFTGADVAGMFVTGEEVGGVRYGS
ncbi:hypothetical protein ABL78_2054 [Leptomonas seymouri]|uniref:Uncharacterized protein n=1 Tax=Leptomonas seymouri TaxID=5684 RepID=A0A0N1I844_LEPSE|nr:hypothetical protein ABL78_2054 [Leptomonas seymouri]|eukprot:KPI88860.1 hypothetical protein ABL78_2054 [Leptomonas seymouri]